MDELILLWHCINPEFHYDSDFCYLKSKQKVIWCFQIDQMLYIIPVFCFCLDNLLFWTGLKWSPSNVWRIITAIWNFIFFLLLHYVYLLSNIIKLKECYCSELKWYKNIFLTKMSITPQLNKGVKNNINYNFTIMLNNYCF